MIYDFAKTVRNYVELFRDSGSKKNFGIPDRDRKNIGIPPWSLYSTSEKRTNTICKLPNALRERIAPSSNWIEPATNNQKLFPQSRRWIVSTFGIGIPDQKKFRDPRIGIGIEIFSRVKRFTILQKNSKKLRGIISESPDQKNFRDPTRSLL